jgi:hypothetical protein
MILLWWYKLIFAGYGVFAKTDLNPGDFICHYKGELIEGAEGDRRLRESDSPGSFLLFFFQERWKNMVVCDSIKFCQIISIVGGHLTLSYPEAVN